MISKKIRQLRKEQGWTQKQLSEKLHVGKTTVSNYETGYSEPDIDMLKKIAKLFNVSVDYILGNDRPVKGTDYTTINVYGLVPAGIPLEAIEDIIDTEDISYSDGYSPYEEYMGLRVDGDSMYPDYLPGDTIIIQVTPVCENGEDCVVYVNGYDATLKTVIKNDDGTITLKPINPEYAPRTIDPKEEEITILGVVKEIRRKR